MVQLASGGVGQFTGLSLNSCSEIRTLSSQPSELELDIALTEPRTPDSANSVPSVCVSGSGALGPRNVTEYVREEKPSEEVTISGTRTIELQSRKKAKLVHSEVVGCRTCLAKGGGVS